MSYDDDPNTHVQLLDAAFPGTLPVIDRNAVRLALLTAIALDCDIVSLKHYAPLTSAEPSIHVRPETLLLPRHSASISDHTALQ